MAELKIVINLDDATIGDLEILDQVERGERPMSEALDFFDRVMTVNGERNVRGLPLPTIKEIWAQMNEALKQLRNPEGPGGN
jgi:hypothetical protein